MLLWVEALPIFLVIMEIITLDSVSFILLMRLTVSFVLWRYT